MKRELRLLVIMDFSSPQHAILASLHAPRWVVTADVQNVGGVYGCDVPQLYLVFPEGSGEPVSTDDEPWLPLLSLNPLAATGPSWFRTCHPGVLVGRDRQLPSVSLRLVDLGYRASAMENSRGRLWRSRH